MRRGVILAALLLAFAFIALFFSVTAYVSDQADVAHMYDLINDKRKELGRTRLRIGPNLHDYAERRAQFMANHGRLGEHNPCDRCGEISGATFYDGPGPLFRAWMRSPTHRAIILLPGLEAMGCGKARSNHIDWWACEFRY